jgi:hypothetical protein
MMGKTSTTQELKGDKNAKLKSNELNVSVTMANHNTHFTVINHLHKHEDSAIRHTVNVYRTTRITYAHNLHVDLL